MGPYTAEWEPSMRRWEKRIRGQSLVEFALVLPIFLLLLIGIAEFGRAWMTRNILTGASREAVRIAAVQQGNEASARSRANEILASAKISGGQVSFDPGGSAPYGTYTATVSCPFPVTVAGFLPGLANITLSSSTTMRKEF